MEKAFCPECNEWVEYNIKSGIIKDYKGKEVNVEEKIAYCNTCRNELFVEEIEEENLKRLYDEYRKVAGIVSPEDIIKLRKKYGLSQRELGNILGWGKMTVNRYERGALPDKSHSDLIKLLLENDEVLRGKVEEAYKEGRITEKTYNKLLGCIENHNYKEEVREERKKIIEFFLNHKEDIYNGFKRFDFEKLENLISYIADKVNNLYQTSLNKYLWYIDFAFFNKYVRSVTGLRYIKYQYGPVIDNFVYRDIVNYESDKYYVEEYINDDGSSVIKIKSRQNYDLSIFSEKEMEVINEVIEKLKNKSCAEISVLSHYEKGWEETDFKSLISYDYAKYLRIMENFE